MIFKVQQIFISFVHKSLRIILYIRRTNFLQYPTTNYKKNTQKQQTNKRKNKLKNKQPLTQRMRSKVGIHYERTKKITKQVLDWKTREYRKKGGIRNELNTINKT